jgi:hypothetical protein
MTRNDGRYFRASMDTTALVTTVLITALFVWVAAIQYSVIRHAGHSILSPLIGIIVLGLVYGFSFCIRVNGYLVTADEIIVLRPLGKKQIPIQNIRSAEPLVRRDLTWSIRTFGVGGLFGYYGKFYNSRLGSMTWYLTRRDATVLLRLDNGKKIVLSPDDPQEFINVLVPDHY